MRFFGALRLLGLWQHDPERQFAQLLRHHVARRPHQQVVRLLVHREQRYLTQVLGADEQHHDAVDAGRHSAVRRRAVLECTIYPAEAAFDIGLR